MTEPRTTHDEHGNELTFEDSDGNWRTSKHQLSPANQRGTTMEPYDEKLVAQEVSKR